MNKSSFFSKDKNFFGIDIHEPLPEWALMPVPDNSVHIMQGVLTRDGRFTGNGIVVDISIYDAGVMITVVTEAGNIVKLSFKEFNDQYWSGKWIMKDFPTTEAKKVWKDHLDEIQCVRSQMEYS